MPESESRGGGPAPSTKTETNMERLRGPALARRGILVMMLGLLVTLAHPAVAQSLDALRASGAVGERYDGYAVVREPNAAGAKSVVDSVNQKRRAIYEERAAAEGVSVEAVGKVYAKQIVQQAPRGTWFLDESGKWRQK